ncbi:phage tail tape measure protein [Rugamonas rubra]|uniref:Phage-related minor tail protein n=1 Tax=Rugamonas rubra TaxID=758825 RepID=A0A1I4NE65_9BURK|nr:phage tail tape measure protein [Rugamonas rubra]SFM13769.1 Phage-related minor tail protein [Rugamonas rubra]
MANNTEQAAALVADGLKLGLGRVFGDAEARGAKAKKAAEQLAKTAGEADRQVKGLRLQAQGYERIGASMKEGKEALGELSTLGKAVMGAVNASAEYQVSVRAIANEAGASGAAGEARVAARLALEARQAGVNSNELAGAVGKMINPHLDGKQALDMAPLLTRFAVGQGVSMDDSAKLMGALAQQANINSPAEMRQALNGIVDMGQRNKVDLGALAKTMPALLAEMNKLGVHGQAAPQRLASMLERSLKTADSPEAAAREVKEQLVKLREQARGKDKKTGQAVSVDTAASLARARAQLDKVAPAAAAQPVEEHLDKDFGDARSSSKNKWGALDAASGQLLINVGDALRPYSDKVAVVLTDLSNGAAELAKAWPNVTAGLVGVVGALAAYKLAKSGVDMARGTGEVLLGGIFGRKKKAAGAAGAGEDEAAKSGGVQRVYVTNWPVGKCCGGGDGDGGDGGDGADASGPEDGDGERQGNKKKRRTGGLRRMRRRAAVRLGRMGRGVAALGRRALGLGGRVFGGIGRSAMRAARATAGGLGRLGRGAAGLGRGALSLGRSAAGSIGRNAASLGRGALRLGRGAAGVGGRLLGRVGGAAALSLRSAAGAAGGLAGRLAPYAGRLGGAAAMAGGALQAYQTYRDAKTKGQKAEGYGGAAGALAGGMLGAKVGAAIGTVAGPFGILAGAAVVGALGAWGGEKWVGAAAKALFGDKKPEPKASTATGAAAGLTAPWQLGQAGPANGPLPGGAPEALAAAARAAAVQSALQGVLQNPPAALLRGPPAPPAAAPAIHFAPAITVTVQGDVKEPASIARELMPHLQRLMDELRAGQARTALFDGVHV